MNESPTLAEKSITFVSDYQTLLRSQQITPLTREQESALVAFACGDGRGTRLVDAHTLQPLLAEPLDKVLLASLYTDGQKGQRVLTAIETIFREHKIEARIPYTNEQVLKAYTLFRQERPRYGYRNVGAKTIQVFQTYLKRKGLLVQA